MASIAIVLGSVRPGRAGEQVTDWIREQAEGVAGIEVSLVDLKDFDLPIFAEATPPSMQAPTQPEGVRFREVLEAHDAVVFVTPEYNHSIPGGLKNALDYLPPATLKERPVGLVGYSWSGALKPLDHLREVLSTFGTDVRDQQVSINLGTEFVDGRFEPSAQRSAELSELLSSLTPQVG